MNAEDRWARTWSAVGVAPPPKLLEAMIGAYSEDHRRYHTVEHLAECFGHLDACPITPEDPAAVELALWFHDAIYDTRASDNEARSAEWAMQALGELDAARRARIDALILVTKHEAEPATSDEELLLDIDLSILGAPDDRFAAYDEQVRGEFEWVPEDAYRTARARILRGFLDRPRLYHTTHFHDRFEATARRNLARTIAALESA